MKKRQTKAQRFRQLLPEIEKLQKEYLQETVVEILNAQYGLEINLNTFKNYLHRYRDTSIQTGYQPIEQSSIQSNNQVDIDDVKQKDDGELSKDVLDKLRENLSKDKQSLDKTASIQKSIFNKG